MKEIYFNHDQKLELPKKRTYDELIHELVDMEKRALTAEKKLENYQYLAIAAEDAVNTFPTITLRTLRGFITKMNAISEALKQISL